jgi:hypothetical protein
MSTRSRKITILGSRVRPVRKADNLTAMCEPFAYKLWEPRRLTSIRASTACYRDSFTIFCHEVHAYTSSASLFIRPFLYRTSLESSVHAAISTSGEATALPGLDVNTRQKEINKWMRYRIACPLVSNKSHLYSIALKVNQLFRSRQTHFKSINININ